MRAERSAGFFRRRNKPRYTQTAIIRRYCRKLRDISLAFEIFRRLNAPFTELCVQKVVHASRSASIMQCKVRLNVEVSRTGEKYRLISYKIYELL